MPGPVSATSISTIAPVRPGRDRHLALRRPAIASIALRTRLISTCWIWMRSTRTHSAAGIELQPVAHAESLLVDESEHAGFLDQLRQMLDLDRDLAVRDQLAHPPHDLAGAMRRRFRAFERIGEDVARYLGIRRPPLGAAEEIAERGQRLVELVRERRRHRAHRARAARRGSIRPASGGSRPRRGAARSGPRSRRPRGSLCRSKSRMMKPRSRTSA